MCAHVFKTVNDVSVCVKCGVTFAQGKIIFDRRLVSIIKGMKQ